MGIEKTMGMEKAIEIVLAWELFEQRLSKSALVCQVDALTKRHIWAIREREPVREREPDCCGQKIAYFRSANTA